MLPYSFYKKNRKKYIVLFTSIPYCLEYIYFRKKYNIKGIPIGNQKAVEQKEFRLDTAEILAEDSFCKAQSALNEAINRLAYLQQQKKFLQKHASNILCCSLKTIDKLDTVEEKEVYKKEEAKRQVLTLAGSADISGDPLDNLLDFAGIAFNPDLVLLSSF